LEESLTQLGVGGVLAFLIIKEVLGFLGKKNAGSRDAQGGATLSEVRDALLKISEVHTRTKVQADICANCLGKIEDLHDWHKETDSEGVRRWYFRDSWAGCLERIDASTNEQLRIIEQLTKQLQTIVEELEKDGA